MQECDCATGVSMAAALDLCDTRFLLGVSEYGDTPASSAGRRAISRYGAATNGLGVRRGCAYSVLDTGAIDPVTGGICGTHRQPGTDFGGSSGCAGGAPDPAPGTTDGATICDVQQLEVELVAPTNATGFSFDLIFISSEYPEWVGSEFLDTYYTLVDVPGSPRINITADTAGQPLTVSNAMLEDPPVTSLAGTGYSDIITSTGGTVEACGSSSGWLRTTAPVEPGQAFTITFSIHDEGDGIYDSLVILDDFRWLAGAVTPGTLRI
jgi:hypothetical protein